MTTSRDILAEEIKQEVGATEPEQITKINLHLTGIFLAMQLNSREEIICENLNHAIIKAIRAECVRRYRSSG